MDPKKQWTIQRVIVQVCGWLVLALVLFALSIVFGFGAHFPTVVKTLVTGWWNYPVRVLPDITWNASLIVHGVIAAVLAATGLHFLLRWIAAHRQRQWRWKWTLLIVLAIGLLFDAAIAMTGIIHQSTWLAREGISRPGRNELQEHPNARRYSELAKAVFLYAVEHGEYPPTLESLAPTDSAKQAEWEREVLGPDSAPRPVYFPGQSSTTDSTAVLMYCPVAEADGLYVVTCAGGSTEVLPVEKLLQRIARSRKAGATKSSQGL